MKGFCALLRLQLLSRLADLKPRNLRRQLKEKKAKTVGMIFAYLFLLIYLGGFLVFLETVLLDQVLIPMGIPDLLLTMAVTVCMLTTLIMSFFFIMSALYFGRDAAFIASLPVKPRTVLAAKGRRRERAVLRPGRAGVAGYRRAAHHGGGLPERPAHPPFRPVEAP